MTCGTRISDAISTVHYESAFGIPGEAQAWPKLLPPCVERGSRSIHAELFPFGSIGIEERQAIVCLME